MEEEEGEEAGWNSLTGAGGLRMNAKPRAVCPAVGLRPPGGSGRQCGLPGHQAQFESECDD